MPWLLFQIRVRGPQPLSSQDPARRGHSRVSAAFSWAGPSLLCQFPVGAAPHSPGPLFKPLVRGTCLSKGQVSPGRQRSPGSGTGHRRWTRGGEAQGAGEGRLPTWGLTPAARQRRLDPGAIKPVHRERGGTAAAARASVQTPSSRRAAARPPPAPSSPRPALLLQLTQPSDPRGSGGAQRPPRARPTPKRPSPRPRLPKG